MVPENTERTGGGQPRIDVWRLGKRVLLALVIPCTVAVVIDAAVGTWPWITLAVAALSFPIAGLVVMRAAVQEMQKVIEQVAPERAAEVESSDGNSVTTG